MSSDLPAKVVSEASVNHYRGMTCRELSKVIFAGDAPEQIIQQLPAQTLHMVAKLNGLASSSDLIEAAHIEQCRLMLDFDIWNGDELNEEALWSWLGITEDENSLELLQKVLKCIDLKIIALLISRYVEVKVLEEPTDSPPAPNFHTPDKGFTWVGIKCEDGDRYFLLARLLALIFETSAELYYQLLSTPGVATDSMLIEESYNERMKRLAAEGVPEPELAAEANAPLSLQDVLAIIDRRNLVNILEGVRAVEPLLFEARATRHLASMIDQIADKDQFAAEFTYLLNAAVVHLGVDFSDQDRVLKLAGQVKGAINLGIEVILEKRSGLHLAELHALLGLQKLYRIGFTFIRHLGRKAQRISDDEIKLLQTDSTLFSIIACLREPFPEIPAFLNDDGQIDQILDRTVPGQRPIESISVLRMLERTIEPLTTKVKNAISGETS